MTETDKIHQETPAEKPENPSDQEGASHRVKITGWKKFLLEFGPLLSFLVAFLNYGMMIATVALMVTVCVSMLIHWFVDRHIPKMLIITTLIVLVMGGLTLWLNDDRFIKMKLTIINSVIAITLFVGLKFNRVFLKSLLGAALHMQDQGWRILTRNYALFSLGIAGLNELVWRTQTDFFWVNFKTFAVMPMMMIFLFIQIIRLQQYIDFGDENQP